MRRRLRVAGLVALLVVAGLVFAMPEVVTASRANVDPDRCQGRQLSVVEWAREPAEINTSRDQATTYETLTSDQQALFDRGRAELTSRIDIAAAAVETADNLPTLVIADGTVYRAEVTLDRCPLVSFLPATLNPAVRFFLSTNRVVTGPLAPVIVVVGGVALAFRLGRKLEY